MFSCYVSMLFLGCYWCVLYIIVISSILQHSCLSFLGGYQGVAMLCVLMFFICMPDLAIAVARVFVLPGLSCR